MDERETTGRRVYSDSEQNKGTKRRQAKPERDTVRSKGTGETRKSIRTDEPRRREGQVRSRRTDSQGDASKIKTRRTQTGDRPARKRSESSGYDEPQAGAEKRSAGSSKSAGVKRNPAAKRSAGTKRKKKKQRIRIGLFLLLFLIIVLILGAAVGTVLWKKYGPTKETYDLDKYFGIESERQAGVTIDNEVITAEGMIADGQAYLSYEAVRDHLNDRFYWDANENILLYTLPQAMVRVDVGSKDYTISKDTKSEDYVILKTEGSKAYIALDFVQQYTNLDYKVYQKPDRIMIISEWGEIKTAAVKRGTQVRYRGGVKSPILKEVKKGEKLIAIEDEGDWKKVRTEDGLIGYVQSSKLRSEETETIDRDFTEEEFTSIRKDKTINLVWHVVTNQTANSSVLEAIANTKGLTTLSPTWFSVADNDGNLNSLASSEYVNYAHQSGIEVWGLVDNFSDEIDQMELLSHTSARENLENQLISQALQTGLDGINVDFELIPENAGEHFIQFIRELSVKCRLNNLVLSVDNYVPMGYNQQYHRKEQGIVADYVIIMGYDEHYGGSYEAGSVASYGYVKNGIEETLKEVPAQKVINAMPFYTRLWNEVPKTEEELAEQKGTEAADYPLKVTSEALGMKAATDRVNDAGANLIWDDTAKQNYAEWEGTDGSTYRIWMEDAASLEAKLQLMKDNKLAGTAGWRLGLETPDIWELIVKYVN